MFHLPQQLKQFAILGLIGFVAAGCAAPTREAFTPPVFPPEPEPARYIYERTLMSSADVEEVTSAERFKMFATGVGKQLQGLAKPFDVAVHRGRVFVTDTVQRAIVVFDIPAGKFTTFGTRGAGILSKPIGIDISDAGEVFVADNTARRIVVFDQQGQFLRAFGGKEELLRPSGLAVTHDGRFVFVVDTGGVESDAHYLFLYDARSGKLLRRIGKRGSAEGEFNLPLMVDVDKQGRAYVVDSGNFRIQRFTSEGDFDMSFGRIGTRFGQFSRPKGIATDNDGNVYVVDTSFGNFQIFNDEGQLLLFIGSRGENNKPAKFSLPAGIDVDEDGRIYVVDQFFTKVEVFRPYGMKEDEGFAVYRPRKK